MMETENYSKFRQSSEEQKLSRECWQSDKPQNYDDLS